MLYNNRKYRYNSSAQIFVKPVKTQVQCAKLEPPFPFILELNFLLILGF
jgi:hypothetical protein